MRSGERSVAGWLVAHIGTDGDCAEINGLSVWKEKWRFIDLPRVKLPHPSYPNQIHDFQIYEIGDPSNPTRFAAAELSACVWGFYVPEKPN